MAAPPHVARANGKYGGRPPGAKNKSTLFKEAMIEIFHTRTARATSRLFESQLSIATGIQILFKIEKEYVSTGRGGFWRAKKPVIVEDLIEISNYLEGRIRQGTEEQESTDPGATYYYMTVKEPSNFAIDSMLDRTFGRARQPTVVPVDKDGQPIMFVVPFAIADKHGIKHGATSNAK